MKCFGRWIFNGIAAISLLLCLLAAAAGMDIVQIHPAWEFVWTTTTPATPTMPAVHYSWADFLHWNGLAFARQVVRDFPSQLNPEPWPSDGFSTWDDYSTGINSQVVSPKDFAAAPQTVYTHWGFRDGTLTYNLRASQYTIDWISISFPVMVVAFALIPALYAAIFLRRPIGKFFFNPAKRRWVLFWVIALHLVLSGSGAFTNTSFSGNHDFGDWTPPALVAADFLAVFLAWKMASSSAKATTTRPKKRWLKLGFILYFAWVFGIGVIYVWAEVAGIVAQYHPFRIAYEIIIERLGNFMLMYVAYALPAFLLMLDFIIPKPRLPKPGFCIACGYDLRATPDKCPECGTVPPMNIAAEVT